ncbi:hypothetical protein BJ138DRAFT_1177862 [Hygrophoropsis aurantiaca]|uniref:Uncharacterized protein n=1 Tax=Hygrophoropsis aurantiaca TaxID=72124 RepID=A0ACB8AKF4_9AGAM|nr:hypothetical protein BJ138DRAFT_1177862 [Hygrophoropsis aurantiaca]
MRSFNTILPLALLATAAIGVPLGPVQFKLDIPITCVIVNEVFLNPSNALDLLRMYEAHLPTKMSAETFIILLDWCQEEGGIPGLRARDTPSECSPAGDKVDSSVEPHASSSNTSPSDNNTPTVEQSQSGASSPSGQHAISSDGNASHSNGPMVEQSPQSGAPPPSGQHASSSDGNSQGPESSSDATSTSSAPGSPSGNPSSTGGENSTGGNNGQATTPDNTQATPAESSSTAQVQNNAAAACPEGQIIDANAQGIMSDPGLGGALCVADSTAASELSSLSPQANPDLIANSPVPAMKTSGPIAILDNDVAPGQVASPAKFATNGVKASGPTTILNDDNTSTSPSSSAQDNSTGGCPEGQVLSSSGEGVASGMGNAICVAIPTNSNDNATTAPDQNPGGAGQGTNAETPAAGTAGQGTNAEKPAAGAAGQGTNTETPAAGTARPESSSNDNANSPAAANAANPCPAGQVVDTTDGGVVPSPGSKGVACVAA